MIKYETEVVSLGPLTQEFIDSGILVFFDLTAPEELAEFAILHKHNNPPNESVAAGDTLVINDESFQILAVGDVANDNLANLGHIVVKFNGKTEPEMPGDICVDNLPLPTITPGTWVKIISEQPETTS